MFNNYIHVFLLTFSFSELKQAGSQVCDQSVSSLSRQHVGVFLTPFLREESLLDGGNDLIPLVEQIFSRFSKIMVQPLDAKSTNDQRKNIPVAVAKFNAMKSEEAKRFSPIQVILEFKMPDINILLQSQSGQQIKTSLDVVLHAANKANEIYPQTVYQLCFLYHELSWSTIGNLNYLLEFARTKLSNASIPYKLGATLQLKDCEEDYIQPVIANLDFVFFSAFPNSHKENVNVTVEFENLHRSLKGCVKKLGEKISLGFHSTWSDTIWNRETNVSNLVQFWNLMNNFAVRTNTTVIFFEAFDNPFRETQQEGKFGYNGWWKLKPNKKYASTAYFVFEEKCFSNYTISTKRQENKNELISDSVIILGTVEIIVVSIGVTGILIGMVSLVSVLIYRKLWKKAESILSKQEERDFFEGNKNTNKDESHALNVTNGLPYDVGYELSRDMFTLDETELLGIGAFGTVCLAKVFKNGIEQTTAVKKAQASSVSLKSLMCEIKVLSYLGNHENIVRIVGAYTAEFNKGVMYLFMELCSVGSLEKFLRKLGKNELDKEAVEYLDLSGFDITRSTDNEYNSISTNSNFISDYLRQWCQNIVHAMEYLALKHVVHGDLATRNILLCRNLNAKLCDFGLSRRMYEYTSYLKSNVEPLPWRWMAPESLLHWEFNEKTDVWAFGITVWEISTFGGVPYAGLQWSVDFVSKLENGMRLSEPKNSIPGFYQLMKECWELNPTSRPTFSQLSTKLSYVIVL